MVRAIGRSRCLEPNRGPPAKTGTQGSASSGRSSDEGHNAEGTGAGVSRPAFAADGSDQDSGARCGAERGLSSDTALARLEAALASLKAARDELTLFVSGASAASARAIINARALCDGHLGGRYELTIVDVNQNPELARGSRVLATPTLLKAKPAPERMVVGDLSDLDRVLAALDLLAAESSTGRAA